MAVTHEYIGDGGMALGGSAASAWHKFAINDFAYTLFGANKGELQKVCVKKIFFNDRSNEVVKVYQDTFNALWLEHELFTLSEAQAYIAAHIY